MTSAPPPSTFPSRAIILAAGLGSRLVQGKPYPKPLQPVAGTPLIERVLAGLRRGGVTDVAIIIGHLGDVLQAELTKKDHGLTLHFFVNDEYEKPNGTSLLKAGAFVVGPTFLLMSDHLWSADLLRAVGDFPLGEDEAVLGIDFDIPRCFDLPDATKVVVDGDRVAEIHKELETYDALDTGVFCITPALIDALRDAEGPEGCSLSAGVGTLGARGKMRVADVGKAVWIDVDTPEAHQEAARLIAAGILPD